MEQRNRPRPPRRTEAPSPNTRQLFCRSAAVLGRPRRTEPPSPNTRQLFCRSALVYLVTWSCTTGAAEDGRAPTEELSCVRAGDFCSTLFCFRFRALPEDCPS